MIKIERLTQSDGRHFKKLEVDARLGLFEVVRGWLFEATPDSASLTVLSQGARLAAPAMITRQGDIYVDLVLHKEDLPPLREIVDAIICEGFEV